MRKNSLGRKIVACVTAAALCFGVTGVLAGCSQSSSSSSAASSAKAQTRTFTDSLGRQVEIPVNIDKVTPSGATATMILAVIAPEKMASLGYEIPESSMKYFPDLPKNLPNTGAMFGASSTFNVESVASTGTQLIIDTGEVKKGMAEDLDEMQKKTGIPCVMIETTLDKYDSAFTMLSDLLGKQDRGNDLAKYCKDAYNETVDTMKTIPKDQWVRMAYLMGDKGLNAIAKDSYQGGVIDLCADNVFVAEKASGSGQGMEISMEQLQGWNPACIVFGAKSIYDTVGNDATWQGIAAIANKNYYEVPTIPWNWLNGPPTVNQVMGMQWLPRLLYPNSFKGSIEDVTKTYYKKFFNYDLSSEEFQQIAGKALPK